MSKKPLNKIEYVGVDLDEYDPKASEIKNVARGLFAIASSIRYAARHLGTNDAATQMGALEAHASLVGAALDGVACAISSLKDE